MKRFRFTLLAVCVVLFYLGWMDASLFFRNPEPLPITASELNTTGNSREWLHVTDGYLNLEEAISTSGSIELDALLVPLTASPEEAVYSVIVETRDPKLLEHFTAYNFKTESALQRERYLKEHYDDFHVQRSVTGMEVGGLIASGNRDKLLQLAKETGMDVSENVLFLSEGKEPAKIRGFFFLGIAFLGLVKIVSRWKTPPQPLAPSGGSEGETEA